MDQNLTKPLTCITPALLRLLQSRTTACRVTFDKSELPFVKYYYSRRLFIQECKQWKQPNNGIVLKQFFMITPFLNHATETEEQFATVNLLNWIISYHTLSPIVCTTT
jgi:hypothetical protein